MNYININGELINLDNMRGFNWDEEKGLRVYDMTSKPRCSGNTPAARRAYEWLCSQCVATFEDNEIAAVPGSEGEGS